MNLADQLRHLHEYASTHKVYSLDLLLDAAKEIERLETQAAALKEELAEREAEEFRAHAAAARRSLEQKAKSAIARAQAELQGREARTWYTTEDLAVKHMREATGMSTLDCRAAIQYAMKYATDEAADDIDTAEA